MRKSTMVSLVAGCALCAAAEAAEAGKWNTSVALGVNATDGNSKTMTLSGSVASERKTDVDAWKFGVDGLYGEIGDSKTNENVKAVAGYRHAISDRWYALTDVNFTYDAIADVDYRVVLSPGLGYFALKNDAATLGLEAGPSYIWEKVGGVKDDYPAVRLAERYDRKLSASSKCWQALEYLPSVDDLQDDYLLNTEIGVEAQLNATLAVRLVVKDTYDSTPAAGREGNDVTVIGALAYTL